MFFSGTGYNCWYVGNSQSLFLCSRCPGDQDYHKFVWEIVHAPIHCEVAVSSAPTSVGAGVSSGRAGADDARGAGSDVDECLNHQTQLCARVLLSTLVLAKDRSALKLWFAALKDLCTASLSAARFICVVRAVAVDKGPMWGGGFARVWALAWLVCDDVRCVVCDFVVVRVSLLGHRVLRTRRTGCGGYCCSALMRPRARQC